MLLNAPFLGEVKLAEETLNYLKEKGYKKIGLYASVQFINSLGLVKEQLKENKIEIVEVKQLLGCDCYSIKAIKDIEACLYVGDGRFHPLALVYAQKQKDSKEVEKNSKGMKENCLEMKEGEAKKIKEVICNDPIGKIMAVLGIKDVEKTLKRQKASFARFLSSRNIGVIISIKPGQEQMKKAFAIENKYPDKRFYYFLDDNISFGQLENFPFVEIWVNTACPRIGLDEQEKFRKGVVNLKDVLEVVNIQE